MQAKWGIAWLVTAFWLLCLTCAPGLATGDYALRSLPILPIEAQSSLENQMLGEKPQPQAGPNFPGVQPRPSLQLHPEGGDAGLKLPFQHGAQYLHPV